MYLVVGLNIEFDLLAGECANPNMQPGQLQSSYNIKRVERMRTNSHEWGWRGICYLLDEHGDDVCLKAWGFLDVSSEIRICCSVPDGL